MNVERSYYGLSVRGSRALAEIGCPLESESAARKFIYDIYMRGEEREVLYALKSIGPKTVNELREFSKIKYNPPAFNSVEMIELCASFLREQGYKVEKL